MGFERNHDAVREELARVLACVHRIELELAVAVLRRAQRAAIGDPARRSLRQWFAILIARDEAAHPDTVTIEVPQGATGAPLEDIETMHRDLLQRVFLADPALATPGAFGAAPAGLRGTSDAPPPPRAPSDL